MAAVALVREVIPAPQAHRYSGGVSAAEAPLLLRGHGDGSDNGGVKPTKYRSRSHDDTRLWPRRAMTRSQGFTRGDLDTSFPLDDKMLALRGTTDTTTYYAAVGVYFTVVAAAWREAERKPASRIVADAPELIAQLVRVGLLDGDERVQKRAYMHSVARAISARRQSTERKQRNRAGMSRGTDRDSRDRHAVSTDIQSGAERSGAEPYRAVPTDQSGSVPRAGAKNGLKATLGEFHDVVKPFPSGKPA